MRPPGLDLIGCSMKTLVAVALVVLGGCSLEPGRSPGERQPRKRDRPVPVAADGERCPEGSRTHLIVERGRDRVRDLSVRDALKLDDVAPLQVGRHRGEPALALATLLEDDAEAVEVTPCHGEPVRIEAAVARAKPERYLFVANSSDELKLLDTEAEPGGLRIARNIAVVRVLP